MVCTFFSCSKSETGSNSNDPVNNSQRLRITIDGVAKEFLVQASKINNAINVVGQISESSSTANAETISFTAFEDPLLTKVYSLTYTADGITYYADDSLQSTLTQHSNGVLKGSFSGTVSSTDATPQTKTISQCVFNFIYDQGSSGTQDINDALHMSFNTPDWNRFIPCDLLNLVPWPVNEYNYVSATSSSTNQEFFFTIPADSSAMVANSNLRKYFIRDYATLNFEGPFEFAQRVPVNAGSSSMLYSLEELSTNSYNEVASITYEGSESNYAVFKVKCRYKMISFVNGNPANSTKTISGTYHLRVRTSKN